MPNAVRRFVRSIVALLGLVLFSATFTYGDPECGFCHSECPYEQTWVDNECDQLCGPGAGQEWSCGPSFGRCLPTEIFIECGFST
jgi:hypothetical protein